MANILESYLISIGAVIDAQSFRKFDLAVSGAEKSVAGMAYSTAVNFAKMDAVVVSSLTAVGLSIMKMADNAAMADQSYRLFGMRMLMTKESARAMQMTLDELGATIDEVAFDPELNKRFQELFPKNLQMGSLLGPHFDKDMEGIRSIRIEYQLFKKELDVLSWGISAKLFEKLGLGTKDFQDKIKGLNTWFKDSIPKWADIVSERVVPVWNQWVIVGGDLVDVLERAAGSFSFLVGTLDGDNSIEDATFSMNKFGKATGDVVNDLTGMAEVIQVLAKTLIHFTDSVLYDVKASDELLHGHFSEAKKYAKMSDTELNSGFKDSWDLISGKGATNDNPDFKAIRDTIDAQNGSDAKSQDRDNSRQWQTGRKAGKTDIDFKDIDDLAGQISKDLGVPKDLIMAQWQFETGNFSTTMAKNWNFGNIQRPGWKGGPNRFSSYKSGEEFKEAYENFLSAKKYKGIGGVKTAEDWVDMLSKNNYFREPWMSDEQYAAETKKYLSGIKRFQKQYNASIAKPKDETGSDDKAASFEYDSNLHMGGVYGSDVPSAPAPSAASVNIDNVTINVPHDLPEEKWHRFVRESFRDLQINTNRNTMAQTAGGSYY